MQELHARLGEQRHDAAGWPGTSVILAATVLLAEAAIELGL